MTPVVTQALQEAGEEHPDAAMALIRSCVAGWAQEQMRSGTSVTAATQARLARALYEELYGMGPLAQIVADPEVENIDINGCDQVWVSYRDGRIERGPAVAASNEELIGKVQRWSTYQSANPREFSWTNPLLNAALGEELRLSAVMSVTPYPCVSLRFHRHVDVTLNDLVQLGTLDPVLAAFLRAGVRGRRPVSPATMHRIRATLRHALNLAIKQERLIDFNPAAVIELPDAVRPKALVWTAERVRHWQGEHARHLATVKGRAAGKRINVVDTWIGAPRPSPVMVWTPEQTGRFLAAAATHRLFALYRLVALRGLRRGEACGLRWKDVDLDSGVVAVCWQVIQLGWDTIEGKPKTDASERVIALDAQTMTILQAHRKRQARELLAAGPARVDSGFVFTNPDGSRLHPQHLTDQFCWLAYTAGLPPIRLHDLRHGAASMMLAAGVDVKIVQETLGHTSSSFTRDTYTSVYPEVAKAAAEKTAALVIPAAGSHR
ncbi:tyrosine-type recombinase/integrase [Sphaerisporangium flaviroseum]